MAVAGLASFVASAQEEPAVNESYAKASAHARAYVISRDALGKIVCRDATASELSQLNQRDGESQVIYEGAPNLNLARGKNNVVPNALLQTLQPSAGLRIVLHATANLNQSQNTAARNAFIVAANRWESIVSTPITVVLDVDFGTTFFGQPYSGPNVLGATATADDTRLYADVRARLLANSPTSMEAQYYNALPAAAAGMPTERNNLPSKSLTVRLNMPNSRALGLVPDITNPDALGLGETDAGIGFNSAFPFDFDPTNGVDSNKIDFDSVATHEIGHALGFSSESGGAVYAPVSAWDMFRFRSGAASLGTFGVAPRIMTAGGTQVYFNGQNNGFGTELRLSTGGPFGDSGDGEQSSHWKDDNQTGQYIGIMDPNISDGVHNSITTNDASALDSFGYSIGNPVPAPPPPGPAPPSTPPNDNFNNAIVVADVAGATTGNSTGATKEGGEPAMLPGNSGGLGGRSIWYRWTSPVNGTATFETQGSGYDTLLAVSTGSSVNSLTRINQNDDLAPGETTASRVTFSVNAGVTYQLAVDGYNNGDGTEFGIIQLNWSATGTAPPTPSPSPTPTPPIPATVTGRVLENGPGGSAPMAGVLVGLFQNGVALQQMTTGADGRWSFNAAFIGQAYDVPFVRSGYSFTPPSLIFPVNQALQDMGDVVAVKGNSIDASDFFVSKHYDDFLGRVADPSGLAFWVNNIESCGFSMPCREVKRIDTSAAFFLSIEFQETGYLVYRAYKAAYGDAFDPTIATPGSPQGYPVPIIRRAEFIADTPLISQNVQVGVGNWQATLEANKVAFMLAFVDRARFTTDYPASMTADQFVTKLDQRAGGVLSASEKAALLAVLGATPADNAKRAQVLRAVAEDSELNAHELNRAFVLMQYFGYLRRDANTGQDTNFGGYKFWLDKLNEFNGDFRAAEMVKSFLVSGEYRGRF